MAKKRIFFTSKSLYLGDNNSQAYTMEDQ